MRTISGAATLIGAVARLVVRVRFVEWTADGHLRHAAFLGVREDKEAAEVRRQD